MTPIRGISYFLIGFAALCWIGAAWVGITNAGTELSAISRGVLEMFAAGGGTSALIAIALGVWFKD
jgi:hypothetical protein